MNINERLEKFRFGVIASAVLLVIGALIIGNATVALILSNVHVGILLTFLLGAVFLVAGTINLRLRHKLPKFLIPVFCLLAAFVFLCMGMLYLKGNAPTDSSRADVILVLGAGIRGENVSENLKNRLDCAIACRTANPDAILIVSGGQGPQEDITEALAMERYLIAHGVPAEQITKEESATSTEENFKFSKKILDERFADGYRVLFVTNDYHVFRAEQYARITGFSDVTHCGSSTPWYLILPNGIRECLAVLKMWIGTAG